MSLSLVSVPGENLGWSGGNTYLANLKLALSELENEGKIKLLPFYGDWLRERYPFNPVAKKVNNYGVSRDLSNVAFLPWSPVRRLPRPLIWIPDVQDRDMPEMFSRKELRKRENSRKIAISRNAVFYFSSREMEARFLDLYSGATSAGVVRFTFKNSISTISETTSKLELKNNYFYAPNQFWKHKNHLTLLNAFKEYKLTGGSQDLVLSGDTQDQRWPEYSREIIRLSAETLGVHSLGFIPRDQQLDLFLNASAVIQPSLYEGRSSSIEEALCFGLPIMVSDIPVHREQTERVENVQFFDPHNSASLKELLHQSPGSIAKRNDEVARIRWTQFKSDLHQMIENYVH